MHIQKKAGIIFLSALFLFSCKKKSTNLLTTRDNIVGSWLLQEQGSDNNDNRNFETEERSKVADSAAFTFQLKNDGTGFRIGANNTYVDSMDWELFNNESSLHFKIYDRGFINNLYFKFDLGTKTLLLKDTTVSPMFFREFSKKS